MRRLLLSFLILVASASFAFANSTGQLCYTTDGSNCIPVGTSDPLPVGNATPTIVTSSATVPYSYTTSSDKQLIFAHVVYTASSTVGNRYVTLQLVNSTGTVIGDWHTSAAITAGETKHVEFIPGTYRETTFDADNSIQTPFPTGLIIPKNYYLKIVESSGVITNDTMTIGFEIK